MTLGVTLGVTKIKKEKPNVSVGVTVGVTPLTLLGMLSQAKRDKIQQKNGYNRFFEPQNAVKLSFM